MSFFDVNPNSKFCERTLNQSIGSIHGQRLYTEYMNSISSIMMMIYGLIGLFYLNTKQTHFILFMYSVLVVCGIGSTLYHLTFMWGFALADGMPMIFMTSIGLLILIWDIVYEGHKNNRISAGVALLFTIYLFVTLIVSATAVNYILYVILFAFPLLPILIYMIYYYINYNKLSTIQDLTNENYKKVRKVILNAIITGIVGFIMWLIDQLVCPHYQPIVYLWGHAIWHVLIGYFAMSMITFASHIYANNYNQQSNIIYAYKIFPLSKWE